MNLARPLRQAAPLLKTTIAALAAFAITGCASMQLPTDRLERNEASVRAAEEMGASGVPEARLHLQMAKDQTETAKRMASNGDERSVLVLARAEADAELALGMAREVTTHTEAERAAADLQSVQSRPMP
jgi:hypothetical protein